MFQSIAPASLIVSLLVLLNPSRALGQETAQDQATPVSPGYGQGQVTIADTCPTFSWGAAAGALRYELAFYDGQWQDSPSYADQTQSGSLVRQIEVAAPPVLDPRR